MKDFQSKFGGKRIDQLLSIVEKISETGWAQDLIISTTYEELRELKKQNKLSPGMQYRITDFVTETSQTGTRSAGHAFDVIVIAIDESHFANEALAMKHDGDSYFANNNLSGWRVWYDFDNDTSRHAWAKKWADEVPQRWTTQWGILEEKLNNDESTNYTEAIVDGASKYLYRPDMPTNFLDDKQFYYYEFGTAITINDMNEVYIVSENNPFTSSSENITLLCVLKSNGVILDSWRAVYDWEHDGELYNMGFGYEDSDEVLYDMQHYIDDTININGKTYYRWECWGGGYESIEPDIVGNSFASKEKIYFNGEKSSLYYAFNSPLSKRSTTVEEVYSSETKKVYLSDNLDDSVTYTSYKAASIGHKGVIYRLIDEFGNDLPFDFKNIQFNNGGSWYYAFGTNDASLSGASNTNAINVTNGNKIPIIIFKGATTYNAFCFPLSGVAVFGDVCQGTIIEGTGSGFSNINVTGALYGNLINCNSKGSLTINGRMTACLLRGVQDAAFTGRFFYSEFANRISVSVTDSNNNAKLIRNLRAIGGNEVASVVRIISDLTESTNYTNIANVELMAINWGQTEVNVPIDSYFPKAANYIPAMLKISKNSNGVVKCWREADVLNQISAMEEKINKYHPEE